MIIDYSRHSCVKCDQPAFGYMRGRSVGHYLCDVHFWALYTRLFTLMPLTAVSKDNFGREK